MQNLTKGELVFRLMIGILIVVAMYLPGTIGTWLLWVLAAILVVSGVTRYCPVCQIVDKH
jgi:uncharacterized membrane protein YecN with MAPEG domain